MAPLGCLLCGKGLCTLYRVLVLIGLGIQLRTGKNMSNQNKHTVLLYDSYFPVRQVALLGLSLHVDLASSHNDCFSLRGAYSQRKNFAQFLQPPHFSE